MKAFVVLYLAAAAVLFPLDLAWLTLVAADFYKSRLGNLLLATPRWGIAAAFYGLYIIGIVVFAMLPALAEGSWRVALARGALFGFLAYATYDLTNLATLNGFPPSIALVDLAWGTCLTAISATLGFAIATALFDL